MGNQILLRRRCFVLLIRLGYHKLASCSSEAYLVQLCAKLMNWAETESAQEKPRTELVGAAGMLCAELLGRPWPLEYRAPVERFAEAMRDSEAVEVFAAECVDSTTKRKQMKWWDDV